MGLKSSKTQRYFWVCIGGNGSCDRSWYVVRNTPGVTGFYVGSATKPVHFPEIEQNIYLNQGLDKKPTINVDVEVGETVRITSDCL